MQIIKNTKIRERWHRGNIRKIYEINEIVIHATAGGGVVKWIETSDERGADWRRGIALFHFFIDRPGNVTEIINPDNWVYHSSSGVHDRMTIGIELEKYKRDNSDSITLDQAGSLIDLLKMLCLMYPNINSIVSHDYNAKKYSGRPPKPCPGAFPIADFTNMIKNMAVDIGRELTINL